MKRRSGSPRTLVAIVGMLLAISISSATVAEGTAEQPKAGVPGEKVLADDPVAMYAGHFGLDYETALNQLQELVRLRPALASVVQSAGDDVAGAWIEHVPELRGVVALSKGASSADVAHVNGGASVDVLETSRPPLREVETILAAVNEEFGMELDRSDATTSFDESTGELVLVTHEEGRADSAGIGELASRIGQLASIPVRNDLYPGPPETQATAYGGSPQSSCTSGFAVNGTFLNRDGLITAGHCSNTLTYQGYDGTTTPINFMRQERSTTVDAQWGYTSHTEADNIWANSTTSTTDVEGLVAWANLPTGDWSCHRGKATGYSCGVIETRFHRPPSSTCPGPVNCANVWVRVAGSYLKCFGGDSGGPFFENSEFPITSSNRVTAHGILSTVSSNGLTRHDCFFATFTSISRALDALGLTLKT